MVTRIYRRRHVVPVAGLCVAASIAAGVLASDRVNATTTPSKELVEMFEQDQSDRRLISNHPQPGQWAAVKANDQRHYRRVLELLKQDKLKSGDDYYYAAMIMQHGDSAKDFMLAHIFAMSAAQAGNKAAIWLSAASFDRLMQCAGQPQVFGTQYFSHADEPYRLREPLATDLIPDTIRRAFNVPTLAEDQERIKMLNSAP